MSRRETVLALPDEAQLPAGYVKGLIKDYDDGLVNEAHARQLTIEMWRARCMRNYLRDFPWDGPQPDVDDEPDLVSIAEGGLDA